MIENIVNILKPVRDVTNSLSSADAWLGDVLPLLTAAIDNVCLQEVPSDVWILRDALIDALTTRMQYMLDTEEALPCGGRSRFMRIVPNEAVIAAIINPRFSAAVDAFYGFNGRWLAAEIERIIGSPVMVNSL